MRYAKRLVILPVFCAAAVGAGVAVALAASDPTPRLPVAAETVSPPFTAPSGPAMSPSAATRVAIAEASRAGDAGPTSVSQMQGTFARLQSVLDPHNKIAEAPEAVGWANSAAYLTVMHGSFTSSFVAPGTEPVKGDVMALVTDAHSGWVEGQYIGARTPTNAALLPVSSLQAAATVNRTARIAATPRGTLVGRLVQSNALPGAASATHGLAYWPVVVATRKLPVGLPAGGQPAERAIGILARVTTGAEGWFSVRLPPGRYVVAGVWRSGSPSAGEICTRAQVTLAAHATTRVVLGCSGP